MNIGESEHRPMRRTASIACALTAFFAAPLQAKETKVVVWGGEGELGYTRTTGNTETESLTARIGMKREGPRWRAFLNLEGVNKTDRGVSVAERYYASAKGDYKLTKRGYLFARADYEDDAFSGYEYRANIAAGYGHRIVEWEVLVFNVEMGPGTRVQRANGSETDAVMTGRLAGDLLWRISEHAKFTTEGSAVRGGGSTDYRSFSAVTAKLNSQLALRVSFLYRHSTEVPAGRAQTDTESAVTLVYGF